MATVASRVSPLPSLPARPPPSRGAVRGAWRAGRVPRASSRLEAGRSAAAAGQQVRHWQPPAFGAGELARERAPVDLDFCATTTLEGKKGHCLQEVLPVCSSLSFHLPSPLFFCLLSLPAPSPRVGGHPWSERPGGVGGGQRLPVLKS